MKVQDVMTADVFVSRPNTNLSEALQMMWEKDCGVLPVVDDSSRLIGIVTDRDIAIALGTRHRLASELTVGEIMSGEIQACHPESDVVTALGMMREMRVRRLPVTSSDGGVHGIISISDIVRRAETGKVFQSEGLTGELVATLQTIYEPHAGSFAGEARTVNA